MMILHPVEETETLQVTEASQDIEALRRKFPQAFRSNPPMLAGTVIAKPVRCGKPSCKCANGALHGPYFYHSWRSGERIKNTYVPLSQLPAVVAMCRNRQALQAMARDNRKQHESLLRSARQMIRDLEKGL